MTTTYTHAQVRNAITICEGHPDIDFLREVAAKMEHGHDYTMDLNKLNTMLRPIGARLAESTRIIRRNAA